MTIAQVLSGEKRWHVECGDSADVLKTLPENSIDALVCDPPCGINFMNLEFDSDRGGRDQWIEWLSSIMREAIRVLKPGGHALVWALPRTQHWTAFGIENAGWQIRDVAFHIFSTGFPKSANLSKAADKLVGAKRKVVGKSAWKSNNGKNDVYGKFAAASEHLPITEPATAAAALQGWGSALKPAVEEWILARKPFRGSLVANAMAHGTGGLNIDGCRVPHASAADLQQHADGVAAIKARGGSMGNSWKNSSDLAGANDVTTAGRWPAHLLLSHSSECKRIGVKKIKAAPSWNDNRGPSVFTGPDTSPVVHAAEDGTETVEEWECVDGCAVATLDKQGGNRPSGTWDGHRNTSKLDSIYNKFNGTTSEAPHHGSDGGASRFFNTFETDAAQFLYEPKPSRSERELGLEQFLAHEVTDGRQTPIDNPFQRGETKRRNVHPTVKSISLMRWLCRLITPPGGIVLDCFAGSGSTGVACSAEGFRFIGIEREPAYVDIARARITGDSPLFNVAGGSR